jgi:hypothetical protein
MLGNYRMTTQLMGSQGVLSSIELASQLIEGQQKCQPHIMVSACRTVAQVIPVALAASKQETPAA